MLNAQPSYTTDLPSSAEQKRKIYRPDMQTQQHPSRPVNIMYDRRIYRGNTYAMPVPPPYAQPDALEIQRQQHSSRKMRAIRRADKLRRPSTPEAVDGRAHMEVQTELYLEELGDTIPEECVGTQTDAFIDRAPSPMFVPAKTGLDAATQIIPGELFDFDIEVMPILEVLVGKTLDRARAEVLEEEELANLRRRQRDYNARRALELAEVHRLEQAERRRTEEKERRKAEAAKILEEQHAAATVLAATSFASMYLSSIVPAALNELREDGFFFDSRERDIQLGFLPWLTNQVQQSVGQMGTARMVIDELIARTVTHKTWKADAPKPIVAEIANIKEDVIIQPTETDISFPIETSNNVQDTTIARVEVTEPEMTEAVEVTESEVTETVEVTEMVSKEKDQPIHTEVEPETDDEESTKQIISDGQSE